MPICKICGANKERLDLHVKLMHHLKMYHYDKLEVKKMEEETDPIFEEEPPVVEPKKVGRPKKVKEEVQPKKEEVKKEVQPKKEEVKQEEVPTEQTIKMFCREMGITEVELRQIVDEFKTGKPRNQLSILNREKSAAEKKAEALKDKDRLEIAESMVADVLTKKFGFTCTKIERNPMKRWILVKNK